MTFKLVDAEEATEAELDGEVSVDHREVPADAQVGDTVINTITERYYELADIEGVRIKMGFCEYCGGIPGVTCDPTCPHGTPP